MQEQSQTTELHKAAAAIVHAWQQDMISGAPGFEVFDMMKRLQTALYEEVKS